MGGGGRCRHRHQQKNPTYTTGHQTSRRSSRTRQPEEDDIAQAVVTIKTCRAWKPFNAATSGTAGAVTPIRPVRRFRPPPRARLSSSAVDLVRVAMALAMMSGAATLRRTDHRLLCQRLRRPCAVQTGQPLPLWRPLRHHRDAGCARPVGRCVRRIRHRAAPLPVSAGSPRHGGPPG